MPTENKSMMYENGTESGWIRSTSLQLGSTKQRADYQLIIIVKSKLFLISQMLSHCPK